MPFPTDPTDMPVPERLAEIARLLATGHLRQQRIADGRGPFTEKPLDVPAQPRPPLGDGLTAREEEVTAWSLTSPGR